MKLSALLIAKNEAAVIEGCLNSLAAFDEVVVVDTGSEDATKAITRTFANVELYEFPWIDDFAAARNFAFEKATGDWCMQIDADHRLMTPVFRVKDWCRMAVMQGHDVCSIRLIHAGSQSAHDGAWLFRNISEIEYVGRIHEVLNRAATLRTDIEQLYNKSPSHDLDPDRNLRILLQCDPQEPRTCFYLGREYADRNAPEQAAEWMNKYLEIGRWEPEICEAHLTLARSYWVMGQGDKARTHCLEAVRNNPMFKEALLFMAELHYEPWKARWTRLAAAATNEGVLFVRTQ